MTAQMLKVLSALLSAPEADWYGFDLCKRAGMKPGTIYPIFARLLEAGWVERRWEEIDPVKEGRPRRRLYRFTAVGVPAARQALDQHLAALQPRPGPASRPVGKPGLA
jgi:PadR family transcriptional regulator, regulatory protein PadR